ncbi:MAG: FAD/NAD(P)-binding oxidoreductase [Bacteroidetes bacterium]|nr:FAD/NAD(P)-binding oxidoreductase [Bacteroidota bacterium]MDA0873898.1 FAD/NAD(P)-binding oxidoreductase [Bacteroidota bacterium]
MARHHQVLIIGGGTAGITVAAQLRRKDRSLGIAIIEPSEVHYYQPAWTLVGAGTYDLQATRKPTTDFIPSGVTWIKERVATIAAAENKVTLQTGEDITYDWLVVAAGIQIDWHKVKGLPEAIGKGGVCSNYGFEKAPYTWEVLQSLKAGDKAFFTQPNTPIKCGGAPQKIMWLTADYLRRNGLQGKVAVEMMSPGTMLFGVEVFRNALLKVQARYGAKWSHYTNLVEIRGDKNEAVFDQIDPATGAVTGQRVEHYDMIHVVPPQSAPDFIKQSDVANADGWVDVDKHTLQHNRFPNVFSLGDSAGTPNAKTGAAVRKQAPVMVANMLRVMKENKVTEDKRYFGYTSCPLTTGYGEMLLAEFDYDNNPDPSLPINTTKPRWSMWLLKKYVLPVMYWQGMLKGRA